MCKQGHLQSAVDVLAAIHRRDHDNAAVVAALARCQSPDGGINPRSLWEQTHQPLCPSFPVAE
jgi:hypothetical protein